MYSPWGPFTQMVKMLGVENPPQWLGDHHWALPAIMLMTVWSGVGYAMMIYTSSITALPKDIYEAADIDGAGEMTKFFKITIPFLSPTTFFLVITTFISSFQVFAPIQIMTRGGPGTATHVLVYYIYTTAFTFYRMGICGQHVVDSVHHSVHDHAGTVAGAEKVGQLLRREEAMKATAASAARGAGGHYREKQVLVR